MADFNRPLKYRPFSSSFLTSCFIFWKKIEQHHQSIKILWRCESESIDVKKGSQMWKSLPPRILTAAALLHLFHITTGLQPLHTEFKWPTIMLKNSFTPRISFLKIRLFFSHESCHQKMQQKVPKMQPDLQLDHFCSKTEKHCLFMRKVTLGQISSICPKIHIFKISFLTKFTFSKSLFPQSSHFSKIRF